MSFNELGVEKPCLADSYKIETFKNFVVTASFS